MNDPNGPILLDGIHHLYFQYVEDTPRRGRVMWGHATSSNLVAWTLHEPAILPGSIPEDVDGAWSGNTVLGTDGLVHAFYSGYRVDHPYQSVIHAVSADGFGFRDARAVGIDPDAAEGVSQFRDPFVWREGDGWRMLVGVEQRGRGAARTYTSTDLHRWALEGDLANAEEDEQMWECPQYLEGDAGQDALLYALWRTGNAVSTNAVIGHREGGRLVAGNRQLVDHGTAFYAPSLQPVPGGTVLWGWIRETRDTEWAIADDWAGHLSLPRRATIEGGSLIVRPAPELELLRHSTTQPSEPIPARSTWSTQMWHASEIDTHLSGPCRIGIRCADGPFLAIDVSPDSGAIEIRRDGAGNDPRAERSPITFTAGAFSRVQIYVDGSSVELFTDSGHTATFRVYPTSGCDWVLEVTPGVADAGVQLHQLRIPTGHGAK